MKESQLTKLVKSYLDLFKPNIWYWKVSDRYTSGIPDIVGVYNGNMFVIELKGTGEDGRSLQKHNIKRINKNGGFGICTDNIEDVYKLFERML